jgi:Fic family protein
MSDVAVLPPWQEIAPETRSVERRWGSAPDALGSRRSRSPYAFTAYVPWPLAERDVQLNGETTAAIAAAQQACTELNLNPPDALNLEALARQLLRAEAVASSRIEGLVLSHRRLAHAFFADAEGNDTAAAVVGAVRATERAIELASSAGAITVDTITEIHRTLLEGTRDENMGGVLREEQNWLGGSSSGPADADFVPPPHEFVRPALEDLTAFLARTDLAPVFQAAVVHAQFETIHPFLDGNGRVGRALIHVVFRRRGLTPYYVPPVSLVLAGRAGRYVQGLTDYRFGDENAWYLLFAEAVEAAADGARQFAARVRALQDDWLEMAGNPRPQSGAKKLIEALPVHPIVNLRTVQEITGVSPEAARQALNRLQDAGVLRSISIGRRNRAFETVGLFALLDAFERDLGAAGRVPIPSQHY